MVNPHRACLSLSNPGIAGFNLLRSAAKQVSQLASQSLNPPPSMPIFSDCFEDDRDVPAADSVAESPASRPVPIHGLGQMRGQARLQSLSRRISEESIRTELCEGPLPDVPQPRSPEPKPELGLVTAATTSDRAELIERLKRGESPTWVPSRRVRPIWNFMIGLVL